MCDVAAGYEGEGNPDADDEGGDAIDERNERRGRPRADFGQRKNYVVHDDIEGNPEEGAVERRMTGERQFAAGEQEDGSG